MVKKFEASIESALNRLGDWYQRYHVLFDVLYYMCYIAFLVVAILVHAEKTISTAVFFNNYVKQFVLVMDHYLLPGLAICALVFDFKDKRSKYISFFALYILMLYQIEADNRIVAIIPHCSSYYFGVGCLAVAAKGRDFRKIGWIYVGIHAFLMVLITAMALTGIIPDLTFDEQMRANRHSLGMTYPLHYAAHWLSIVVVYNYLKNGFLKWWDYVGIGAIVMICAFLCKAQTTTLLLMVIVAGSILRRIYTAGDKNENKQIAIPWRMLEYVYPFMAMVMILLSFACAPLGKTLEKIPLLQTINSRFVANRVGLKMYFPTALGTFYPSEGPNGEYFFDTSYVAVLVGCGVVLFLIIMFALWYMMHRMALEKQWYGMFLLALMAISFAMEDRMLNIAINPFWLMLFADISTIRGYSCITENSDNKQTKEKDQVKKIK